MRMKEPRGPRGFFKKRKCVSMRENVIETIKKEKLIAIVRGSDTPALGYTVTYAVGNTLLIIWGVAIVLLM